MLETLSSRSLRSAPNTPSSSSRGRDNSIVTLPNEVDRETIDKLLATKKGQSTVRARWQHNKSVSSAYWDSRGRSIVSTSYDDTIRRKCSRRQGVAPSNLLAVWDIKSSWLDKEAPFPSSRPFSQIKHNCQTVGFLTSVWTASSSLTWPPQGKWLTILKAQWTTNPDVYPHFTVRSCPFA